MLYAAIPIVVAVFGIVICYVAPLDLRRRHPRLTPRIIGMSIAVIVCGIPIIVLAATGH